MAQNEEWTIGRLLSWTTDYLKRQGSDSPRLDAEILLAHARQCERIRLYTDFHETVTDQQRGRFRQLVLQRAKGVPVAYLVGHREFYSLRFRVTPDVLIPRPETELLVVRLLDLVGKYGPLDRPLEIVDVGTGSGVIAVCAAKYVEHCRVTAIDISPAALDVARENAVTHQVEQKITFVQGDLLEPLAEQPRWDFILSNPPYVGQRDWHLLSPEVREHEPSVALLAGPRGDEIIARLVPQAAARLVAGGWLLMEISPLIHQQARQLVAQQPQLEPPEMVNDLAGLPRLLQARRRLQQP